MHPPNHPSSQPSNRPPVHSSTHPSPQPSNRPPVHPSNRPLFHPSIPPSVHPSTRPLFHPSNLPPVHSPIPTVWSIAGTDPTAGAGIQADLKTFQGLGVYGCSVITALIAQNTLGVRRIDYPDPDTVRGQLEALEEDFPPAAIKIGMLGNQTNVRIVAETLSRLNVRVVCDPVIRSSSGTDLLEPDALSDFITHVLPRVDLLTPNLPEAERLTGNQIRSPDDVQRAAATILDQGAKSVLIKGGHREGALVHDYWTDGTTHAWFTNRRVETRHTHGTGCALSSALAAAWAQGYDDLDAVVMARMYVNQGLRRTPGLGRGNGPIYHGNWPSDPADLPWITSTVEAGASTWRFPNCDPLPMGLYPIVDSLEWVQKLLALGVRTVQLRIKKTLTAEIAQMICEAVALGKTYEARVYINDHWRPALDAGAYGVHLGQDDLDEQALRAIEQAGCRLGLSTHSYAEIARAWAYRPSYIAIGTVFDSPSKDMTYKPLGVEQFTRLRAVVSCPVVAIGGITTETAPDLIRAGADGIAVISDVTQAADLPARIAEWRRLFETDQQARGAE